MSKGNASAASTDGISVGAMTSSADREECLRIRYRAYHSLGVLPESADGRFADRFDELGSTLMLGVRHERGLVATMRLCFSRDGGDGENLPCFDVFPEMGGLRRDVGGVIVELSRLAIDPSVTNTSYKSTLYAAMIRYSFSHLTTEGVSLALIGAQQKSLPFYKHVMGFVAVGAAQFYPPGELPITLTALHWKHAPKGGLQNRFFASLRPLH
jgi:hypothetical protein